jgi:hypothetical protein
MERQLNRVLIRLYDPVSGAPCKDPISYTDVVSVTAKDL